MAKYSESKTIKFVNPYNFVSVDDQSVKTENAEARIDKVHTGYLDCELTVLTPLAIPDTEKSEEDRQVEGHYYYHAYRIGEKYAIPGSSIRGMLRSVYETATNSCMVTVNPEEHITRRSELGTFSPGVLKMENGEWKLYKAKRIPLVGDGRGYKTISGEYSRFEIRMDKGEKYLNINGEKLYFGQEVEITEKPLGHEKKDENGNTREVWNNCSVNTITKGNDTNSFLYLGEAISNKHAESVFQIESNTQAENYQKEVISVAMKGLEDTLAMYRSESINRNLKSKKESEKHYGYRGYERAKNAGIIPLWYREKNGVLYLSLAAIGRIACRKTMTVLSNSHAPCTDRKRLCPACAVFGMVAGKNKEDKGFGSRIRVTDAYAVGQVEVTKKVTLKELGSPRSSFLPFYSEDGKAYDDEGAMIRGRKFYWHIPMAAEKSSVYEINEKTKRNATFDLFNSGSKFSFRIYYDSLTEQQLEMLKWTVSLKKRDLKEGTLLAHKLGHGKPLGLGSIKLSITNQVEREAGAKKYALTVNGNPGGDLSDKNELLHETSMKQLEKLFFYDPDCKTKICYPYIEISQKVQEIIHEQKKNGYELKENVTANHQWFREKKNAGGRLPSDKDRMSVYELSMVKIPGYVENGKWNNGDFQKIKSHNPKDVKYQEKEIAVKKNEYNIGTVYEGKVTGHNPSGMFALVDLKNGGRAKFFDKGQYGNGTKVKIKYLGKDGGYDKWEVIKH